MDGAGTSASPYLVTSLADLEAIGTSPYTLDKYYKLNNDIDASATANPSYNSGAGWLPIGSNNNKFYGTFDGNNKTISGLYINRPSTDNVGLFSSVGTKDNYGVTGIVKNLSVTGNVTGKDKVGSIIGYCGKNTYEITYLTDLSFNGTVNGVNGVGGIVGYGEVGWGKIDLTNAKFTGTVTGTGNNIGGIIGYGMGDGWTTDLILNGISVKDATISTSNTGNCVGGIAGIIHNFNIANSNVENVIISGKEALGGIAGQFRRKHNVDSNTVKVTITGQNKIGGLAGEEAHEGYGGGIVKKCSIEGVITGTGSYIGGLIGNAFESWNTDMVHSDMTVNSDKLTITVSATSDFVGGLYGVGTGIKATNCHVINLNLIGRDYIGGIAGSGNKAFWLIKCSYKGTLKGRNYVGGIAGSFDQEGYNQVKIEKCYSNGSIIATGNYIGGLSGWCQYFNINNSYSTMNVSGIQYVGGFAGRTQNAQTFEKCYSTGLVVGNNDVGGFIGNKSSGNDPTNCYWDTVTSGKVSSSGGTGKTSAEMKTQATFNSYDFTTLWVIAPGYNSGYPYLLEISVNRDIVKNKINNIILTPIIQPDVPRTQKSKWIQVKK